MMWSINISESILDYLKNDEDNYVRQAIARNKNTSESTLNYLKNDKDSDVRLAIAENYIEE